MSYQVELRHFRYFLAIAEELHFKKAADKLYISQPGLSRQIRQMEENLGILLFNRESKKVSLTPAGHFLKTELELALKNIDHILEQAISIHEGNEGKINLGYVGSAMQQVIPQLLIQFNQTYPTIRFGLTEMDNAKQIKALQAQDIDVGFVRLSQVSAGFQLHPVLVETFSIVLPKNHPMTVGKFKNLAQLREESFILFDPSYSQTYYSRIMSIFEDSGFTPNISHSTVHANTIFRLVENSFGIAIIPTSLQNGYNLDVKFIELKNIPQRAVLSMVWNEKNRNPILGKMIQLLGINQQKAISGKA